MPPTHNLYVECIKSIMDLAAVIIQSVIGVGVIISGFLAANRYSRKINLSCRSDVIDIGNGFSHVRVTATIKNTGISPVPIPYASISCQNLLSRNGDYPGHSTVLENSDVCRDAAVKKFSINSIEPFRKVFSSESLEIYFDYYLENELGAVDFLVQIPFEKVKLAEFKKLNDESLIFGKPTWKARCTAMIM